ncbi:MAG: hypothetical protein ACLRZN_03660 [Dialister invisus]
MTHFKWLKRKHRWVKEEIITREAEILLFLYTRRRTPFSWRRVFVLAAVCFLTGLIFICAGVWNGLSG